jgi:hypothetical protein
MLNRYNPTFFLGCFTRKTPVETSPDYHNVEERNVLFTHPETRPTGPQRGFNSLRNAWVTRAIDSGHYVVEDSHFKVGYYVRSVPRISEGLDSVLCKRGTTEKSKSQLTHVLSCLHISGFQYCNCMSAIFFCAVSRNVKLAYCDRAFRVDRR